ncbi:MAG: hypothetical protein E5V24_03445 [Mesorhizobium sp.]|nr:MAG: hypothetical protein E5V24_03445 [Mesorhizobium sp.]
MKTKFVHCNICGDRYDLVVGHLLLPDAMPALNAVHLLRAAFEIEPTATSSRQWAFSLYERQFGPWPTYWLLEHVLFNPVHILRL